MSYISNSVIDSLGGNETESVLNDSKSDNKENLSTEKVSSMSDSENNTSKK